MDNELMLLDAAMLAQTALERTIEIADESYDDEARQELYRSQIMLREVVRRINAQLSHLQAA